MKYAEIYWDSQEVNNCGWAWQIIDDNEEEKGFLGYVDGGPLGEANDGESMEANLNWQKTDQELITFFHQEVKNNFDGEIKVIR